MVGTGYVEQGLYFLFLLLITFKVARGQGYLLKSESSLPIKLNYVVNSFTANGPYMHHLLGGGFVRISYLC
jgi:hypothetical protein